MYVTWPNQVYLLDGRTGREIWRYSRPRTPGGLDESGFGFVLIEALAGKWGVRQTATGKAVWVELDARQAANHP